MLKVGENNIIRQPALRRTSQFRAGRNTLPATHIAHTMRERRTLRMVHTEYGKSDAREAAGAYGAY